MLDALGVVCSDVEKSIQFYEIFGLSFEAHGGEDHYEATTESGVRLMLDSEKLIKEINPSWTKPKGSKMIMCFKKNSVKEVDELYKRITDKGYESVKSPWDAFWGQRYSSVLDPDGNQIDIFANL